MLNIPELHHLVTYAQRLELREQWRALTVVNRHLPHRVLDHQDARAEHADDAQLLELAESLRALQEGSLVLDDCRVEIEYMKGALGRVMQEDEKGGEGIPVAQEVNGELEGEMAKTGRSDGLQHVSRRALLEEGPSPSMPAASQSSFTRNDNDKFIKYLRDHKGEAGDGGNFKKVFWHSMVPYMEQYRTRGAPKSATSLKNKWNWHRAQYKAIKLIQSPSGWGAYDEEHGAGVNADTQDSWTEFTARHPECKPYAHKGYPWFDEVDEIIPTTVPGAHVFTPSQGASSGDDQPSQDADADADATMEEEEEEEEKEPPQAMGEEEDDGFVIIESDRDELSGSQDVNTTTSSSHNTAPKPSSSAATHGSAATTATTSSKRRQPASASSALKRTSRVPPSVTVMQGMVDQLSAFNTTFRDLFGPPPSSGLPPTPVRRRDCAARVEEEDWMTAEAQAFFSMILEKDTPAMDTYMGKKGEESRKAYVKLKLQEHSYWSPPEKDVISNMFSSDF
ncbi:uncharacterized protein SCHCODRAFT_0233828 [Schizophyllum commune H4-8]|uniref:Uncharacterized protein n=1 Tax=Schizophyllum commune (strain H4-8 / FGSC 9210) TaxID=578458 RepID=D8PYD3_SCHCM|nr:uncharacterized protein SCHCODRAFT_0233828 [Schizophyllum commune H4-8]KAI5897285.1 hypothetical protein SCHCODRAFT_0233828 [Schizophyllum commune H4-8]